jgi:hypothetical protein
VTDAEFFFAIDLSVHEASLEMFREVVSRLLAQAGVDAGDSSRMMTELEQAVAAAAAGAVSRRVTIEARGGRLAILVTSAAGEVWQVTHSLA